MANFVTVAFSRIVAVVRGTFVLLGDILKYDTAYGTLDFTSDDMIPNIRVVKALISGGGLIPTVIEAGVTPTPLVIAYNGTVSPDYILIRASDNSYDKNTNVQYDGVNFTILGADDGTGKFADSYSFSIRP